MAIFRLKEKIPNIDPSTYVFPSATLIGNIVVDKQCFIGPGVILRGDKNKITIGEETIIQDQVVIHTEEEFSTTIGKRVLIGTGSILHCECIEDDASIGLGVVLGMGAKIRTGATVINGSLVPQMKEIAARTTVAGIPAKEVENANVINMAVNQFSILRVDLREIYRTQLERLL
ncbi:MAG: gamma carbonic anhydrase family protein [Candidatus Heimdallarchaeota archaeon]